MSEHDHAQAATKPKALTTRTVLSVGIDCPNIDAPVQVRLGLFDDRVLTVRSWSRSADGGLMLTLDDEHDEFPVGRCMAAGKDGVRRTATEHRQRGGFALPGEVPGKHLGNGRSADV